MSESLSLLIREIHMAGTTSTYLAGTTYLAGPTWLSGQIGMYKIHNNNKEVPKLLLPDTTVVQPLIGILASKAEAKTRRDVLQNFCSVLCMRLDRWADLYSEAKIERDRIE
jgi:hypothetical protein